jgi:hypothetical protein
VSPSHLEGRGVAIVRIIGFRLALDNRRVSPSAGHDIAVLRSALSPACAPPILTFPSELRIFGEMVRLVGEVP